MTIEQINLRLQELRIERVAIDQEWDILMQEKKKLQEEDDPI